MAESRSMGSRSRGLKYKLNLHSVLPESPLSSEHNFFQEPASKGNRSFIGIPDERPSLAPVVGPKRESRSLSMGTSGRVKIGEKLTDDYDLSSVAQVDQPRVMAAIYCLVTLEESAPKVTHTHRELFLYI